MCSLLIRPKMKFFKKLSHLFKQLLMERILAYSLMGRRGRAKLLRWRVLRHTSFLINSWLSLMSYLEYSRESQFSSRRKLRDIDVNLDRRFSLKCRPSKFTARMFVTFSGSQAPKLKKTSSGTSILSQPEITRTNALARLGWRFLLPLSFWSKLRSHQQIGYLRITGLTTILQGVITCFRSESTHLTKWENLAKACWILLTLRGLRGELILMMRKNLLRLEIRKCSQKNPRPQVFFYEKSR